MKKRIGVLLLVSLAVVFSSGVDAQEVSERHVRAWQTIDYLAYEIAHEADFADMQRIRNLALGIAAQAEGPAGDDVNPNLCYWPSIRYAHRASYRMSRALERIDSLAGDRIRHFQASLDFALTEISEGYCDY